MTITSFSTVFVLMLGQTELMRELLTQDAETSFLPIEYMKTPAVTSADIEEEIGKSSKNTINILNPTIVDQPIEASELFASRNVEQFGFSGSIDRLVQIQIFAESKRQATEAGYEQARRL